MAISKVRFLTDTVRDRPEIPQVFLFSVQEKGGVEPSENRKLEENIREEGGGGGSSLLKILNMGKHVERSGRKGKLLPKDSNTIIVWLLLTRSTS